MQLLPNRIQQISAVSRIPYLAGEGLNRAIYRSGSAAANSDQAGKPSGLQVGDIVLVGIMFNSSAITTMRTMNGDNWSLLSRSPNTEAAIFYKIMTATDINPSNIWAYDNGSTSGIYSLSAAWTPVAGAVDPTVSIGTWTQQVGSSNLTIAGLSTSDAKGLVTLCLDYNPASAAVKPTNFTLRYNAGFGGGGSIQAFADANSSFPGGSATWTGVQTTNTVYGVMVKFS